ncbi:septal ring lytic transglycosylase RlpA family protein [Kaistia soli]|uniref:septal ring lytic transglycosylase RlpA family protein n=1 Tax=Kaistia soli TaxID=446684 RepID=UPI003CC7D5D1
MKASPRVVQYGQAVPQGGGRYMVGKAYTVKGRVYKPFENRKYTAVGYASWYGSAFHGRYTANGEVYDMDTLSAAHPTMPLPSYARVTNLKNGSSVVVRVNDRGPYERDRLIDLSAKTAELLEVKRHGAVKVKVEYIGPAKMEGHDRQMLMATYVAPQNTEIGNPNVMVAMNEVKRASAVAVAMRSQPRAAAPTISVAMRQPAPTAIVPVAMRAPAASSQIVLAMAPIPRARPDIFVEGGTPIDPYNYEIQAAQNNVPAAAPVYQAPAAVAIAEPESVAAPTVVRASATDGTTYGERTLGSFTVDDPSAFTEQDQQPVYRSARSSYASDPDFTEAQRAADDLGRSSRAGLKLALQQAVARAAAERSADATEIAIGVFASDANAAAMAERLSWLGRARTVDVVVGGKTMQRLTLLVTNRGVSDSEAVAAVTAAGARDAYVVTR